MNNITLEQKKRRFRELAQHDRIRTGRQLAEEHEQPFLPFNDCRDVRRDQASRRPSGAPVRPLAVRP
jgi:hypothetical protein